MRKSDIENKIYEVVKEKTNIRGYWKDEKGKLYKDYISLYSAKNKMDFEEKLLRMFSCGEKCIFVRGISKAFIIYPLGEQIILKENYSFIKEKGTLKPSYFKKLLKDYNGFTIFSCGEYYLIDIWS